MPSRDGFQPESESPRDQWDADCGLPAPWEEDLPGPFSNIPPDHEPPEPAAWLSYTRPRPEHGVPNIQDDIQWWLDAIDSRSPEGNDADEQKQSAVRELFGVGYCWSLSATPELTKGRVLNAMARTIAGQAEAIQCLRRRVHALESEMD